MEKRERRGRVLPEHVDLGLRLTVGEGVLKKPFLESTHGEGHFPEMSAQTEPSQNAYFPKLGGFPGKQWVWDSIQSNYSILYITIQYYRTIHVFHRRIHDVDNQIVSPYIFAKIDVIHENPSSIPDIN